MVTRKSAAQAAADSSLDQEVRESDTVGDKKGGGFGCIESGGCLFALDQAVNGGNHFTALNLRLAPQNSNISPDTRVQNFDAEQSVPQSHACSAFNCGPSHAADFFALASVLG